MKISNSMLSVVSRFLPAIEAFFIANTSNKDEKPEMDVDPTKDESVSLLAEDKSEGHELVSFAESYRPLLNACIRQNPSMLIKSTGSLNILVRNVRCRQFLDFDNKRRYFREKLKKQHLHRNRPPLKLTVHRSSIFPDSFQQISHLSREEMLGKLRVTFVGEEGVDAGGLTREWYSAIAKEIFNPDYALFKPSADCPTFQPNPLSYVNRDHLRYFKVIGRIIGKCVADGNVLDAFFTRR